MNNVDRILDEIKPVEPSVIVELCDSSGNILKRSAPKYPTGRERVLRIVPTSLPCKATLAYNEDEVEL